MFLVLCLDYTEDWLVKLRLILISYTPVSPKSGIPQDGSVVRCQLGRGSVTPLSSGSETQQPLGLDASLRASASLFTFFCSAFLTHMSQILSVFQVNEQRLRAWHLAPYGRGGGVHRRRVHRRRQSALGALPSLLHGKWVLQHPRRDVAAVRRAAPLSWC